MLNTSSSGTSSSSSGSQVVFSGSVTSRVYENKM